MALTSLKGTFATIDPSPILLLPSMFSSTRLPYIVLARAKSEALVNIYSLHKQNIKLFKAKLWRPRQRWKTTIGLISIKQLCDYSKFFEHFFAVFCMATSWNFQKLPSYTFYGGNVVRVLVSPFFHCRSSQTWRPLFLCYFLSLYSKFVDRTINLSLIL